MKDIIFKDTVQFGIWKFLDDVNGTVLPQFACAQPIANGVRLSDGHSSVDDVGTCLVNPTPTPTISCDGATDSIYFPNIVGYWDFYLDDFNDPLLTGAANDLTYYLNTEMVDKFAGDFDSFLTITNIDLQVHRFKFVPLNDQMLPNTYTAPSDNPTFMEHDDGSLTFCLAPVA